MKMYRDDSKNQGWKQNTEQDFEITMIPPLYCCTSQTLSACGLKFSYSQQ